MNPGFSQAPFGLLNRQPGQPFDCQHKCLAYADAQPDNEWRLQRDGKATRCGSMATCIGITAIYY